MSDDLLTLGIETSCDETAAAVLRGRFEILSSVVASQNEIHNKYGGVVPELACRRHAEVIQPVVMEALARAGIGTGDVGLVAVTRGPGLVGALLVGLSWAKAFAFGRRAPLVGVNHLEGHMASAALSRPDAPMPAVGLAVSGGHTELFLARGWASLEWLGGTMDDAAGEAFDKVAKLLGLGYPGGPVLERAAREGKPVFDIPVALSGSSSLDFSFSGPKTAVRNLVEKIKRSGGELPVADICASFQKAVVDALEAKTRLAVERLRPASIAVVGGVAANGALRERMLAMGEELGVEVVIPPPELCSDNAAMIASAGAVRYLENPGAPEFSDYLEMDADPSWLPGKP
ncbi:MAG: tRNA (adenosine(37)-N6)-threonylcarbamoyltransferase complex transferase subunit TsaD [Candidatus Nitrospinota bacterium M3_3B_026]